MTCSNKSYKLPICNNIFDPVKVISIQGNKYYINSKYWGKIIINKGNYLKVECDNGNQYMKGRIIEVYLPKT